MINISINEDVDGVKLSELMDFVIKRSDSISVSRYYTGFLDISEFEQMQESYKEYIYKEDASRREAYKSNLNGYQFRIKSMLHLDSEDDAYSYFDRLLEQDLSMFEKVQYDSFSEEPDNRFTSQSDEFIKTKYTRVTPVTRNPVFEMCFFKLGQISSSITNKLKKLYDFPYMIDGIGYEDITFYKNDAIILEVCSHERYANLSLDEKDVEVFKELGITYD
ncbi:hypothetical protein [Lachnoclostridium phytofermentans]|uniref:Uncharacterized protein n=1 Tax=Lachnoclostridium phytofermentans (strain ATCC 700394 / DSM 18823 / ISDg) TaxID=357809 RepID=A9KP54_LACP7|nr:hypothetical protein [Lachnoclostridium phytofermentans]ABX41716.1 hypothetical protein Cphy_1339 [Lachnoclostridium phytofermentans ISDg]